MKQRNELDFLGTQNGEFVAAKQHVNDMILKAKGYHYSQSCSHYFNGTDFQVSLYRNLYNKSEVIYIYI